MKKRRCERQTGFGFGRASAEKRLSMSPEHKPRRASEAKTVVARRRTTDIKVSRYGEREDVGENTAGPGGSVFQKMKNRPLDDCALYGHGGIAWPGRTKV